jgi:hypothetical protein
MTVGAIYSLVYTQYSQLCCVYCVWSKVPSAGRVFPAKAQRFGANDGDACGCRDPLEGVVAATLSALGLWVKTQDLVVSMTAALYCVGTFLGCCRGALVPLLSSASSAASMMLLSFPCLSLICL